MRKRYGISDGAFYGISVIFSIVISVTAIAAGVYADEKLFGHHGTVDFRQIAFTASLITVFCMQISGAYLVGKRRLLDVAYACFITVIFVNLGLLAVPYFGMTMDVSLFGALSVAAVQLFLLCGWAYVFHRLYFFIFPKKLAVVVADSMDDAVYCADKVKGHSREFQVIAAVADADFDGPSPDCETVIAYKLDAVRQIGLYRLCLERSLHFCVVPEVWELAVHKAREIQFGDMMAFRLQEPHVSREAAMLKRVFDIVFSLLALAVSGVPVLLFALIIYLQDRAAPFYTQERLTKDGSAFKLIKLRTMVPDAEQDTGPVLAEHNDPRVTRFGGFLRKARLDELPQFINVLLGDMSVVGPRPERKHFTDLYAQAVPHFPYRLNVKAGITGMAHVYGRYNTPPEERIKLDLYYILNYTPLLDLRILLDTARIMLSRSYSEGVKGRQWE